MTLLSRAKAMPLPEPEAMFYVNDEGKWAESRVTGTPMWTADQLRAAREQIAAEGDEVIGRLAALVETHTADLRSCAQPLHEAGFIYNAKVLLRACDELSTALAEARKA